ncbi:putative mitochondrial COP-coated vesicle membrane protein erv25 precursor [Leptomonas pyrrhocoris]|uniref:Putative mitochondrial COP-coated vesicle membrane protein erv25 n=1 Tax=Leptomonas pyrrhocoris TaxID=157538 RepID=A0A0M9G187_LEPPY|nr:putative mitochondrial COP-coated vesicle membrane protein erv25 precursor [Leptomonas pyrrhocoris]XP_015658612.1 putative mitochondrial COP-coated vesicle membrane protein erv25 precursor [Leptomonas pyrrhocoris]KPA80172.1 putative mitochondrial COP-coated vesicle membrane protein erv25 precursor [Leptomonas pyrrhocoris]KPA80173.1 putative mitochondrial COP-coated vesicle membrane protein erv25 precursor [Leptomonas pyrrhocoris]|eukprot:XP_015658611.1 putative mitochondrial COP-coated vesicle membrane protein erv25 precursor [Leptomonas pyrrhocoris]
MKVESRVSMVCSLALLLLAICHVRLTNALTYHFIDGTPLCFSETIENVAEMQITGSYEWISNKAYPQEEVRLSLSITDPSSHVHYMKKMTEGEHSFAISLAATVLPGEQLICFTPQPKFVATEENPLRLVVELDQVQRERPDKDKIVVENIRKRKQVDGLEVFTFREAGGQLKVNLQPRVYLKRIEGALESMESALDKLVAGLETSVNRESRMRKTSESTFTRVWVCAVLLIGVITGVLWMEFRFLKSTLRKKKLV